MTDGFMPHGFCLHWDSKLILVFIIGNLGIAIAYFLIPLALRYFTGKRKDLPYPHIFLLFAAFILSCGITHLVKIWTLYQPVYWIEAFVDLWTACVSLLTAAVLVPLLPKALQLRSPKTLEEANGKLELLTKELETAKDSLEMQVQERTAQLQVAVRKAQEGETEFHELFDMMPELAWTAKPNGDIDFYNKGWYAYTGTTFEQMKGWGWESVHDPEVLPKVKEAWLLALKEVTPFEIRFTLKGADGKFQWFLTRVNPLKDPDGTVARWIGICTNIQQEFEQAATLERLVQERTEELKTAKDLAEDALEAKSRFLATVSHEVRTPLSGIVGLSELLSFENLGNDENSSIQAILSSSKRLMNILNNLLDASKLEAGKIEIEYRKFPVRTLIADITQLISSEAKQKNLEVSADCDSHIPDYVCGDELRVRQVLLNLAFNAVKFTKHGQVKVSAALLESGELAYAIRFSVSDSGIGIAPEDRARLFQPFEQASKSTSRLYGGTGLGLSITKNLVDLMGGTIGVTSEVNSGSTFWFDITFRSNDCSP
jgi:PAS domain S-box-containing protein